MSVVRKAFGVASGASTPPVRASTDVWRKGKTTRDCPRVTVRLSPEDHAKLQELADGMALSTYLRMMALGEDLPRRRRSGVTVEDREALAQVLGLLGQSRIANNLNQLAYHANIGTLPVDDATRGRIDEAYEHVLAIRTAVMRALGMRG